MNDATKNELTAIANLALRQMEAKANLPGNWHTRVNGHLTIDSEDRGTVEVSFFDKTPIVGYHHAAPRSVWVRVLIVVNRFGVLRTVVWTSGQWIEEKKTVVDGKDAVKAAKAIIVARTAA